MNENVKSIGELRKAVMHAVGGLDGCLEAYEASRESTDGEEHFNEGRYGRLSLEEIDKAQHALTQLRMRVNLQLNGRDNARARQLDRILGIAEDAEDVEIMLDIVDRAVKRETLEKKDERFFERHGTRREEADDERDEG